MALTYPFTLHVEPIDQAEQTTDVASYADLVRELGAAAEVSRDDADALAQKVLAGQEVNVSAAGTGVRLYGTNEADGTEGERTEGEREAPAQTRDVSLSAEHESVLETLSRDPAQNRLVHDDPDKRWYVYEFTAEPPTITDVRNDVAEVLLGGGLVTRVEEDVRRIDLPGDYTVYVLADEGG